MDERILRLKTPADCNAFSRNAQKKGFPELAVKALQRKVQLLAEARQPTTEVERDALQAIYAYEEILPARHGRNQLSSALLRAVRGHLNAWGFSFSCTPKLSQRD